ncbi:MAG: type III pantothenate kinase [Xanthomonadaceae bacterium]|nr:type III pantothenate kinase [Xanthomonadaceae bacterium]
MKLLIDAGNTRLKWAWWDGAVLRGAFVLPNAGVDFSALWKNETDLDAVWISSVASASANAALAAALRDRFGVEPVFAATRAQACGVRIAYATPALLGVDRFLGLIAARAQTSAATVIASCGTALTLDALAADGTHLGGLIAAGPELAQNALRAGAARLASVVAGRMTEIADNSADAIESGTWLSAAALVERFCGQAERRMGRASGLILTGGGAAKLSALLDVPHRIEAELVLRGLVLLAESNE